MAEINPSCSMKRKRSSKYDLYFETNEATGLKTCKLGCLPVATYSGSTAGTNLKQHLFKVHQMFVPDTDGSPGSRIIPDIMTPEKKEAIDIKLKKLVIGRQEEFAIVDDPYFVDFVNELNPSYSVPSRRTLVRNISTTYEEAFNRLLEILQMIPGKVCLTGDGWSSKRKRGFFVITIHWVSEEWNLQSTTLEFLNFPPPHTGKTTSNFILTALKKYKIEKKVFVMTTDNASEMITAMTDLKRILNIEYSAGITYDWHIRCVCHVMNLGVHDALNYLKELLTNLRQLLKCIRYSERNVLKFKEIQRTLEKDHIVEVPGLDVSTGWNSTFLMISNCYKLKDVFNSICEMAPLGDSLRDHAISGNDWKDLKSIADFLELAFDLTVDASGREYSTISYQPIIYDLLINHCQKASAGLIASIKPTAQVKKAAEALITKLQKYRPQLCGMIPCIALALDPRMGSTYPRIQEVKEDLREFLTEHYGLQANSSQSDVSLSQQQQPMSQSIFKAARLISANIDVNPNDEVDDYYAFTRDADDTCDPLKWWGTIGKVRFPTMAKLARDCFASTASSVPSESAFSESAGYVTPLRSRLSDGNLEMQMKLKAWIRFFDKLDTQK